MTAMQLIDSIFARPQHGPPDERRITAEQWKYLRDLIQGDTEAAAFESIGPGQMRWSPAGSWRYMLTEQPYRLTRLKVVDPGWTGMLF